METEEATQVEAAHERFLRSTLAAVPATAWRVALTAAAAVTLISTLQLRVIDLLNGRDRGFLELLARQGLAALAWLFAGVAVVWLARRVPVRRDGAARAIAIHGVAVMGVAAGVNVLIPVFWWLAGLWPSTGHSFAELSLGGFVELLHVNALVYALVSGTVQLLDRRAESREASSAGTGHVRRLSVPGDRGVTMVDTDAIRWIEAAGDYVRLHIVDGPRLLSERMWVLERKLDPDRFMRVHRSAIVRLGAVEEVRPLPSGDAIARLEDGEEVRVSRRQRAELMDRLGFFAPRP